MLPVHSVQVRKALIDAKEWQKPGAIIHVWAKNSLVHPVLCTKGKRLCWRGSAGTWILAGVSYSGWEAVVEGGSGYMEIDSPGYHTPGRLTRRGFILRGDSEKVE